MAKRLKTQEHSGKKENQKGERDETTKRYTAFTYLRQSPVCCLLVRLPQKAQMISTNCVCCFCNTDYSEYYFHHSFRCFHVMCHVIIITPCSLSKITFYYTFLCTFLFRNSHWKISLFFWPCVTRGWNRHSQPVSSRYCYDGRRNRLPGTWLPVTRSRSKPVTRFR